MYEVLFWSMFAGDVLLVIYLSVNPKTHAQPWRLLAIGFASLTVVFWLQESMDATVRLVGDTGLGRMKSGVGLVATAVSAMVGALFGTAITNRAQFAHKKRVAELTNRISYAEERYLKPAEELNAKLMDQTQHLDKAEFFRLVERRLIGYRCEIQELQLALSKLGT